MVNKAFTLAEVLITLGIIGVVAAMTLPTLIQSHKKSEATARLKKFVSSMEQAILFAENDNGTKAYQWTDIDDYSEQIAENPQLEHDLTYAYWKKYFAPYIKSVEEEKGVYVETEDGETDNTKRTKIYFADGSTVAMHFGHCIDLIFDINGERLPNSYGKDMFMFFIATNKSHSKEDAHELYPNKSFGAVYMPVYTTREKALEACKSNAQRCSALLQYDNWEFKDDYPYKL